jgi:hypothetical protein
MALPSVKALVLRVLARARRIAVQYVVFKGYSLH